MIPAPSTRTRGRTPALAARVASTALDRGHRGHLLAVGLQLAGLGLSMAAFRLASSAFGPLGFGEYALARRALSMVTFPLLLGLGTSLPRFAALCRPGSGSPGVASYSAAAALIGGPVLLAASAVIAALPGPFAALVFGDPGLAALSRPTLAAIVGLYLHMLAYAFLLGRLRAGAASLLQLLNVAAAPGLAVLASGGDVGRALLWLGAISSATSIVGAAWGARGLGLHAALRGPLLAPARDLLAFGIPRVPGEFALFGLFALPAFVAARRLGAEEAGFLSFGISLVQLVSSVFAAGAVLLLPQAGRWLAEGRADRLASTVAWALGLALAASASMVVAMELAFEPMVDLILGPGLAGEAAPARVLLPGAVPFVAYIVLRGPLDAATARPLGTISLAAALAVQASWLAAGGPPGLGLSTSLAVLGLLMTVSWRSACRDCLREAEARAGSPNPLDPDAGREPRCDLA